MTYSRTTSHRAGAGVPEPPDQGADEQFGRVAPRLRQGEAGPQRGGDQSARAAGRGGPGGRAGRAPATCGRGGRSPSLTTITPARTNTPPTSCSVLGSWSSSSHAKVTAATT